MFDLKIIIVCLIWFQTFNWIQSTKLSNTNYEAYIPLIFLYVISLHFGKCSSIFWLISRKSVANFRETIVQFRKIRKWFFLRNFPNFRVAKFRILLTWYLSIVDLYCTFGSFTHWLISVPKLFQSRSRIILVEPKAESQRDAVPVPQNVSIFLKMSQLLTASYSSNSQALG
jgi:hypothetical protein